MHCLRRLSKSHRMSIITSIHQPNHEIVFMFDKIYVLSKGGNCLFSGTPKQIPSYLKESNIIINENQVPIEQLLSLASIESYRENIDLLAKKTREEVKQLINEDIKNQMKLTDNGLEFRSKSFKGIDMWYIMTRTVTQQFVSQWKALLIQFLWYLLFPLFSSSAFNEDIGKASACIDRSMLTNTTCLRQLDDDYLIFQNLNFMYFMTLLVLFIHLCQSTLTYLTDLKIFFNEYQNSKNLFLLFNSFKYFDNRIINDLLFHQSIEWYSTGSYFWAKNFVELMPTLLFSMMYAFLVFKFSGQYSEDHRDVQFVLVMMLGFVCTEGIGHTIGIILINYHQIAVMLSLCLFLSLSLFANFFILIKDMPLLFQYMSEISFFKFLFSSILLIIYGQNRCSKEKSYIMLKYGINDNQLCNNYLKLMTYALSLRIIPFLVLYFKNNLKFRVNYIRNKNQISEESIDLNSNYLTITECNEKEKDLAEEDRQLIIALNNTNIKTVENGGQKSLKYRISIAWNRLTLKIPKSFLNKEKLILDNICGYFHFSSINAIMGCSGAGKTSLLKCINGLNYEYLSDETTFLLNKNFLIKSCFITQEVKDHLLTGLTAGQAMTYASKLKNSDPVFDHKKNVEKLMDELLIRNTYETNVENCSGGEQKRLVIAMELTSHFKPNLICIDEPTSGLDSNAAEVVSH